MSNDTEVLLELALRLGRRGAQVAGEALADGGGEATTKSSATDLVTVTDEKIESLIVHGLRDERPDDAILGEEGTSDDGTSGVRWVIDPIDGTTNFVYGLPGFAISIAAEVDGDSVVGVVIDPVRQEEFAAVKDQGATLNGDPIHCSGAADLATALIATGFSYQAESRRAQAEVLTTVLPRIRDIRRLGAAATDLCAVAVGRVDGYWERGLNRWDAAAGALIAGEAGAIVSGEVGKDPGAVLVAAAPGIHAALDALLDAAGAGDT
ncbi:MAG: inositol monophosphatase [Actinomycetia bacterium]|nr:inositol monophosphatase [Actinomycetes bacterium]MCP4084391.1 inositol monophosphatase [Actinomycetes bacterium]